MTKFQAYREATVLALILVSLGAMFIGFIAVTYHLTGGVGLAVGGGLGLFIVLVHTIAQESL